jgi:hypothetical protein
MGWQEQTVTQLADEAGVSRATVWRRARKLGIKPGRREGRALRYAPLDCARIKLELAAGVVAPRCAAWERRARQVEAAERSARSQTGGGQ